LIAIFFLFKEENVKGCNRNSCYKTGPHSTNLCWNRQWLYSWQPNTIDFLLFINDDNNNITRCLNHFSFNMF